MTEEIIAEIKPTSAIRDEKILESITPEYKEKVKYYSRVLVNEIYHLPKKVYANSLQSKKRIDTLCGS